MSKFQDLLAVWDSGVVFSSFWPIELDLCTLHLRGLDDH